MGGNLAGVIRIEKTRLRAVGSGSGVKSSGQPGNVKPHISSGKEAAG